MYRKKNAAEKAKDVANVAATTAEEHKAVAALIAEATDYGPAGFSRLGGAYFVKLEDTHNAACMANRQVEETHVGDGEGMKGKWEHTTYSGVYEK